MTADLLLSLSKYHPVVIEGMGSYDPRDPAAVASRVAERLRSHWGQKPAYKQKLIITQGDPLEDRGISAITPRVAAEFGIPRGLVCLDPDIADYHSPNADRDNVILEVRYSQLAAALNENKPDTMKKLTETVDYYIDEKNRKRKHLGMPHLKHYFRDFALLQEVTKAACCQICNGITIAHTASDINEFSVTSFYAVGLELGLVNPGQIVPYE
ncbi:MAG: hypothetical protein KGY54_12180 [Oleiphilaceae bacterium]|nr:hypothetical protein [Oleiphilaceae bacterium]